VSKSKLYEAKVGVIEMQKKWDQGGSGNVNISLIIGLFIYDSNID
jgi:hypothetical protein